jgi:tight adherence protein B
MALNPEIVIYAVIFIAVLAVIQGIYLVVFGKSISLNNSVNRRLDLLEKGTGREQVLEQLRKEMTQHMNSRSIPIYSILADKAQKAAIAFTPKQLITLMVGVSMMAFVGLTVGTESGLALRAAVSVAMGVGGVYMWINGKAKKRMALIEEQLPDAVELMVRSLKVGHPFVSTISIVSKEISDPLASEFGLIADEAAYGRDVGEALKDLAERLDMQDLRFLSVAVTIQQASGGNLADILAGLAKVIRSRFKLFRKVQAISAEARWSGNFLSSFPLLAIIGLNMMDPTYYDQVMETEYFIPAVLVILGFLITNYFVMKMLTTIRV